MNFPWIEDPKTKEGSVSLTILMVSTLAMAAAVGLQIAGLAKDVSLATEFFGMAAGLYWGRKFTSSKGATLEKAAEEEESK